MLSTSDWMSSSSEPGETRRTLSIRDLHAGCPARNNAIFTGTKKNKHARKQSAMHQKETQSQHEGIAPTHCDRGLCVGGHRVLLA